MIEEFANYIYLIIGISGFIIGFWQFRKWNIEKFKEKNKQEVKKLKDSPLIDQDLAQYINNPELAIKALMIDRAIKEKEGNTKGIESIDGNIKILGYLAQIPAPIRPFAAKLGQAGMKKVSAMVDSF